MRVREPLTGPAQLPASVAAFTGREHELKQLDELLDPREAAVHVITGMAGLGKSALATHWAHRVREQFEDGQLYVNLGGYGHSPPMPAIAALAGFLQALGVPGEKVPPDVEQAAALYRTILDRRQVLVVLDNASTAEQVRPRPSRSTSRRRWRWCASEAAIGAPSRRARSASR